jgi:hypothetical protein
VSAADLAPAEPLVTVPFGRVPYEGGHLAVEVEQYSDHTGATPARVALVPVTDGRQFDPRTVTPGDARKLAARLLAAADRADSGVPGAATSAR